jgi:hypothetical protein
MKAGTGTFSSRCRCGWSDRGSAKEASGDRRQGALPRLH